MDLSARFGRNFVRGVLHQLEELSVTVPALADPSFAIRVFLYETWVNAICFQDACGLFDDFTDDRREDSGVRRIRVTHEGFRSCNR
ncbi:hypothetical protein [Streptomyces sp. NPDC001985]|uniref:hypothetical protein n=1 Tax=Streptomyces sp. NPDC001985 TaxID=3154406 RepID=UPI0033309482